MTGYNKAMFFSHQSHDKNIDDLASFISVKWLVYHLLSYK